MLELMARGGMSIGEVLELTPADREDRKITLKHPKSGKPHDSTLCLPFRRIVVVEGLK